MSSPLLSFSALFVMAAVSAAVGAAAIASLFAVAYKHRVLRKDNNWMCADNSVVLNSPHRESNEKHSRVCTCVYVCVRACMRVGACVYKRERVNLCARVWKISNPDIPHTHGTGWSLLLHEIVVHFPMETRFTTRDSDVPQARS